MNFQNYYFFMQKHNLGQFGMPVTFEQNGVRKARLTMNDNCLLHGMITAYTLYKFIKKCYFTGKKSFI